jgi:peptide/nickel transport system substrate-binding protein
MKLLLALAVASSAAVAAVKNPDTLNYAIMGDVDSLDPAWIYDGISQEIQFQVYETLVMYKGASSEKFEPVIAEKLPAISADGLTYTFPIRKGVKFHDGTPMTPEDVRYSIARFLLMDRASGPTLLLLEPIVGYEATADEKGNVHPGIYQKVDEAVQVKGDNVVLKLKKPCAPLLSIFATYCPVVSKKFVAEHGGWDGREATWLKHRNPQKEGTGLFDAANGTGPFQLERWDKQNKQVILKRFPGYWRAPAKLEHVVFKTVPEASTRKLLLAAGDADAVLMERQYLPQVTTLEGVDVKDDLPFMETHNCFIMLLKINPAGNPYIGSGKLDGKGIPPDFFADKDVRKGFAYAFDYEGYIKDGYRGKGQRARGPIPNGVFGYNPKQPVVSFDLKKAEEHLRKAFGGKVWEQGFSLVITFMEGRADRQLACQILKSKLESLNPKFKVDVRPILWSTYLRDYPLAKLPIVNARWGLDFADPHNAVHPFLHSQGNYSKTQGYNNPKADALIEQAWKEGNLEKRRKLYAQLQAIANEDLPTIFTIDTYNFLVHRKWVKNWTYNPVMMYGYLYPVTKGE